MLLVSPTTSNTPGSGEQYEHVTEVMEILLRQTRRLNFQREMRKAQPLG